MARPDGSPSRRSREKYEQKAEQVLSVPKDDRVKRNRAITGAYRDMYLSRRDTFKWAGMAAFASEEVGSGLNAVAWFRWVEPVLGLPFRSITAALADGNNAVFADLYWQHMAYVGEGLDILVMLGEDQSGKLPWQAWSQITQGLVWEGNTSLLLHEQLHVLQDAVYDGYPDVWKALAGSKLFRMLHGFRSPVPGGSSLYDMDEMAHIASFDDRWRWIEESLLPAWQALDHDEVRVRQCLSSLNVA